MALVAEPFLLRYADLLSLCLQWGRFKHSGEHVSVQIIFSFNGFSLISAAFCARIWIKIGRIGSFEKWCRYNFIFFGRGVYQRFMYFFGKSNSIEKTASQPGSGICKMKEWINSQIYLSKLLEFSINKNKFLKNTLIFIKFEIEKLKPKRLCIFRGYVRDSMSAQNEHHFKNISKRLKKNIYTKI